MPDQKPAQQPATTEEQQVCAVVMYTARPCGRPLYEAPDSVDEAPVCLMHSCDPNKDDAAFQAEFERILQAAGEGAADADFKGFVFPSSNCSGRKFKAHCAFCDATFTRGAHFIRATFTQGANFSGATFTQDADFSTVTFARSANFRDATFTGDADFRDGVFTQVAYFFEATFTGAAGFSDATFTQQAYFRGARFRTEVEFRETIFRHDETREAGPVFSLTRFEKPEGVTFSKTDLGQAVFHNCDVSTFVFSDVGWRKRPNGKSMVFEEVVDIEEVCAEALGPREQDSDERNFRLIAELYQQLKKNYDDRRDYWTAGDFHYGELEMKRLHSPRRNWLVRRLHRHLGLVAWYKYASEYGESYRRPLWILLVVIGLFTLLYPLAGLKWQPTEELSRAASALAPRDPGAKAVGFANVQEQLPVYYPDFAALLTHDPNGKVHGFCAFFGNSLMTTLYVAAFQKHLIYEPSYPWGRLLALVEVLLTSTLVALFLLAVRRQFRR
jgi:uncharacterized protein YjbI with pentapeptide repeats